MKISYFGNPVLGRVAKNLTTADITSHKYKVLIKNILELINTKDLGIGLAAPQIGESVKIAVISIKPTKVRPNVDKVQMVIINPEYEGVGRRVSMWEGCLSSGTKRNVLFAKAMRYKTIQASWLDEAGKIHNRKLGGLVAQVFQHETDHLNGVLFVDRVLDSKTYMHASEYKKRILKTRA